MASIWREFLESTDKKNLITLEAEHGRIMNHLAASSRALSLAHLKIPADIMNSVRMIILGNLIGNMSCIQHMLLMPSIHSAWAVKVLDTETAECWAELYRLLLKAGLMH